MTDYTEYFLKSKSSTVAFETFEIYHPNFTQTWRIVRNSVDGLTATTEESEEVFFSYYPCRIENAGVRDDLDQSIKIVMGDLGEILPVEIDEISSANAFHIKPTVKYRVFRSDNLTQPMFGPVLLEIANFAFNREGATFEAKAPSLNVFKTGEIYSLDRFPTLRGFL